MGTFPDQESHQCPAPQGRSLTLDHQGSLIPYFFNFPNFIYFRPRWVFVAGRAFLCCGDQQLFSSCSVQASPWVASRVGEPGFQSSQASVVAARGLVVLAPWFQSTGLVAPWMWDLSGPGIEPVSPEWAGGFFSMEPQGKPPNILHSF